MAVRPMATEPTIAAVSFVPLDVGRALGVIVTTDGAIEKRVLSLPEGVGETDLVEAENWVGHRFRGAPMDAIRDEIERTRHDDVSRVEKVAHDLLSDILSGAGDAVELLVVGTDNLLMSSDFSEINRVRSVLRTLADGGRIVSEWRRGFRRSRTHVMIGDESDVTASGGLGMVATLFFRDGQRAGALGVVGPRRMDYRRIVPAVELIGDTLTQMLDEPGATHA
jgi:heat-inducible transcriptional repressor